MTPMAQSVLTIGNFDGVHRAHQQLLAQAGLFASSTDAPVTVLTFEPHPLAILAPDRSPPRLSTIEEKLQNLERAGAEYVVIAKSEQGLLNIEAEDFVTDIIHEKFRPTHVVEGPSFGFGKARRGTTQLLQQMATKLDFEVHILPPMQLEIDGDFHMVSSSLIRKLLLVGKVRRAALCLGRHYALSGDVVTGAQRGKTIGFPTANLQTENRLVPGEGVYAGRVMFDDQTRHCAVSIGRNPTFDGQNLQIEAHILDFDGDLYGHEITVEFTRYLRGQLKFESAEALIAQLHKDVEAVRSFSDHQPPASDRKHS
jgi:riboflavin kinase/FMN adenylyltransferase